MPLPQEVRSPRGIAEVFGEPSKGVPFFAVDEVDPGSGFTVSLRQKVLMRLVHANGLKAFDSLQPMA